ncbi:MAG: V-type ATP synthase subunit D [Candidatus Micrarchaeota archaeon]
MVATTRMELIKLKKRLVFARRGHKLLKEKRDSMMKHFMTLIKRAKEAHRITAELYKECDELLREMAMYNTYRDLYITSFSGEQPLEVEADYTNVMSIRVPTFKLEVPEYSPQYGDIAPKNTTLFFRKYRELLIKTAELASLEKGIRLMADEIASTRRRVNALEHVLIPKFEKNAKTICMKLDELERSMFSTLNRISE